MVFVVCFAGGHVWSSLFRLLNWLEMALTNLNFTTIEGMFRVPPSSEELDTAMGTTTPPVLFPSQLIQAELHPDGVVTRSVHIYGALLKRWLNWLPEPLIPPAYYDECLAVTTPGRVSDTIV